MTYIKQRRLIDKLNLGTRQEEKTFNCHQFLNWSIKGTNVIGQTKHMKDTILFDFDLNTIDTLES